MLRRFTIRPSAAIATAAAAGLVTVSVFSAAPAFADDCGYTSAPFTITTDLSGCAIDAGGSLVTLGGANPITVQNSTISDASVVLFAGDVLGSGLSLSAVIGPVTQIHSVELQTLALSSVTGPVTLNDSGNDFGYVDLRPVGTGDPIALTDANALTVDLSSAAAGRTVVINAGEGLTVKAAGATLGPGTKIEEGPGATGMLTLDGATLAGSTLVGHYTATMADAQLAGVDVSAATICGSGTPASLPSGYILSSRCIVAQPTYVASPLGAPIDGGGVLNIAKAGSTLPFKFSVSANGSPVTTLSTATATSSALSCSSSEVSDVVESYSSAAGTLVNNGDGSYQYNYQTLKKWSGSCKTLTLDLGAGLTVSAAFNFR